MYRYSTAGHGSMISDAPRTDAYARAIAQCVKPGDVVLEIGTGTGLFAILACRAGARRVYAVEADDIIEVARANAAANGVADSIEFLHAMSTEVHLPERVDLIVSDLRGVLPLFEHHVGSIVDARTRFLAPGGRLVPRSDRIWAACVEVPELYAEITSPWESCPYGVGLEAGRDLVLNCWRKADFKAQQVLTAAVCCAILDYSVIVDPGFAARVTVRALRDGVAHGLGLWFDTALAEGIGFSCAPGAPAAADVYGHAYFPWPRPMALSAGQEVALALRARPVGGEYLWSWEAECGGEHFRQSSYYGEPLSGEKLRRRAADHVPGVDDEARIDRAILEGMERGLALGEIARSVQAAHPGRFARWEDALARVGDLSDRYAR